jgi:hypothetical protein
LTGRAPPLSWGFAGRPRRRKAPGCFFARSHLARGLAYRVRGLSGGSLVTTVGRFESCDADGFGVGAHLNHPTGLALRGASVWGPTGTTTGCAR